MLQVVDWRLLSGEGDVMQEVDTKWILDTMKEYLTKGDFFGSIKLNFQASRLININVERTIVRPEKQEKPNA